MIKEIDDHYGICCDFCGQSLSDESLGGQLVTHTEDEAHELARKFEWFSEGHKHYCTECVPSVQTITESKIMKWYRLLVPSCSTEMTLLTSIFGIIFLVSLMYANLAVAGVAAIGYGLVVRHHYVMHQRNELLSIMISMLEHDHDEDDEEE